jgi:hypothetical protein
MMMMMMMMMKQSASVVCHIAGGRTLSLSLSLSLSLVGASDEAVEKMTARGVSKVIQ